MRLFIATCITLVYSLTGSTASASTFTFDTDPFAGTPVLTTPGRQIVGGENFIVFNPATDVFCPRRDGLWRREQRICSPTMSSRKPSFERPERHRPGVVRR